MYAMKVLHEQMDVCMCVCQYPCRYVDMQVCRYVSTYVCMNGSGRIVQNVSIDARDTQKHNVHDTLVVFHAGAAGTSWPRETHATQGPTRAAKY